MHFYQGVIVTLRNNMAQLSGGAIYSDDFGSPSDICTIWPQDNGFILQLRATLHSWMEMI